MGSGEPQRSVRSIGLRDKVRYFLSKYLVTLRWLFTLQLLLMLASLLENRSLFSLALCFFSFFRPVGTLTLTPTGMRALEQARGIRGVTL